jgi:hypothetical protein
MSSELVAYGERSGAVAVAAPATVDLVAWATSARHAHEIALSLAETSFVPRAMAHKPADVTGAILAGAELGLSPMAALRSIDLIEGVPSLRAVALRGLVQSAGHRIWVEDSTDTRAIVCGQRAGSPHIERCIWTIDRAKKANLTGKRPWQAYPAAMLIARATSELCRLIAADLLIALPYSSEELSDGVDAAGGDSDTARALAAPGDAPPAAPARSTRTVQRKPRAEPATVEPELTEPTPAVEPAAVAAPIQPVEQSDPDAAASEPEGIQPGQLSRLQAAYRTAGTTDRIARLLHASRVLGRNVESAKDLTRDEATRLIEVVESGAGPDTPADEPPPDDDWPPVAVPDGAP